MKGWIDKYVGKETLSNTLNLRTVLLSLLCSSVGDARLFFGRVITQLRKLFFVAFN